MDRILQNLRTNLCLQNTYKCVHSLLFFLQVYVPSSGRGAPEVVCDSRKQAGKTF